MPEHCARAGGYGANDSIRDFINCLSRLSDVDLIKRFWLIIAEQGIYQKQDSLALAQTSVLLPWTDVVDYATDAITVSAVKAQGACISLLTGLCGQQEQGDNKLQQLRSAALALFAALPGDTKERARNNLNKKAIKAV